VIRALAKAVHDGDMEAELADHTEEIVKFDVQPRTIRCEACDPRTRLGGSPNVRRNVLQ